MGHPARAQGGRPAVKYRSGQAAHAQPSPPTRRPDSHARRTTAQRPHAARPRLPPAPAVVTVMHYQKTGNVSTITRTLEDGGDTYHVVNELCLKHPPDIITIHTYFTRVDDDD